MLINPTIVTRLERDLFYRLPDKVGNMHLLIGDARNLETVAVDPGLLTGDLNTGLYLGRIMSHDLCADPVLQRRDDLSARGVIFGVC